MTGHSCPAPSFCRCGVEPLALKTLKLYDTDIGRQGELPEPRVLLFGEPLAGYAACLTWMFAGIGATER